MSDPAPIVASLVLLATLVILAGFALLPLRYQGLLVETVTLEKWPLEWAARQRFKESHIARSTIQSFIESNPEISEFKIVGGELVESTITGDMFDDPAERPTILTALREIDAERVSVHDGAVEIVLGTESRSNVSFDISYLENKIIVDSASQCEVVEKSALEEPGACVIGLDNDWSLVYRWIVHRNLE